MRTYVLRRLFQIVPLLLGISALTFLLLQLAPGDFLNTVAENPMVSTEALDAMRHRFGLDRPWQPPGSEAVSTRALLVSVVPPPTARGKKPGVPDGADTDKAIEAGSYLRE